MHVSTPKKGTQMVPREQAWSPAQAEPAAPSPAGAHDVPMVPTLHFSVSPQPQ
jgi:hypothetical protein